MHQNKGKRLSWLFRIVLLCLGMLAFAIFITYSMRTERSSYKPVREALEEVQSSTNIKSQYDVIVVGTDPEGVIAAISAARNDLKVLLIETRERDRLGGLMTIGWLNSLDMNISPKRAWFWQSPGQLNRGIFIEWYKEIRGTSFDVVHAANVFHHMVQAEPNIDLLMNVKQAMPIVNNSTVVGMSFDTVAGERQEVAAGTVIDATQDADIAAAAGVPYTVGRGDIGEPDVQMAVTLVIKLNGVTNEAWEALQEDAEGYDSRSIWGYPDARDYESSKPDRVRMRSLNIGREDGDSILINSMQIYGIDPLDPESLAEGLKLGEEEAPRIVAYLQGKYKPFKELNYAGVAPELYVRETRHIEGEYRLTLVDVMDNRDHWDAISYGSYEVDIQSVDAKAAGAIMMNPKQYGVPFRSLVPLKVDGLLVVGRSASFDSLPHGSARVIPLGMATGEAAGAAAKLIKERGITFRELSRSETDIADLRKHLEDQGMDLQMEKFAAPDYTKHKDYAGLLTATSLYITIGGYNNDSWALDKESNSKRFFNALRTLQKRFPDSIQQVKISSSSLGLTSDQPLSAEQSAEIILKVTGNSDASSKTAMQTLVDMGWIRATTVEGFEDLNQLTNGDTFMLIRDLVNNVAGVTYE
ncbi:MAG: FAD-dependent oxidoreductase [Candidatus Cohnella colombiensis]|uniref:FAD-dependent oxidoreductase n=1 Tax=Candidatus Cohnella colombiensis TaxID=3121368 RepID=A0AA95JAM3_9BACL|nr:MAG: FAD-dependent oxidoreductase [Cohnella sp.]